MNSMRRYVKDIRAEAGTSAMIIFIGLVMVSAIVSALILSVGANIFTEAKSDAQQTTPNIQGIVHISILEISGLGAEDQLHLVFELPYVGDPVPDTSVSWVLMCLPNGNNNVLFDEGDFTTATTMQGDGETVADVTQFTPGTVYRILLELDNNVNDPQKTGAYHCDLENTEEATLIIIVDKGRTLERFLNIGGTPYEGQDLM